MKFFCKEAWYLIPIELGNHVSSSFLECNTLLAIPVMIIDAVETAGKGHPHITYVLQYRN